MSSKIKTVSIELTSVGFEYVPTRNLDEVFDMTMPLEQRDNLERSLRTIKETGSEYWSVSEYGSANISFGIGQYIGITCKFGEWLLDNESLIKTEKLSEEDFLGYMTENGLAMHEYRPTVSPENIQYVNETVGKTSMLMAENFMQPSRGEGQDNNPNPPADTNGLWDKTGSLIETLKVEVEDGSRKITQKVSQGVGEIDTVEKAAFAGAGVSMGLVLLSLIGTGVYIATSRK